MAEIEIKYRVEDHALLDRLAGAARIGNFEVAARKTVAQTDEYWDTADGAASKNKVSLRRRDSASESKYTVKLGEVAAGFSRRIEIEEPTGSKSLADWLNGLVETGRLELPFSADDLSPKLRVRNRRTALNLLHPNGAEIELALDRVTFEGPRGEASELEIEGELLSGEESALDELRDWLCTQGELTPSHAGKYERALELVGEVIS